MTLTISGITPFFIVASVPAALSVYHDMLGFEVTFRGPTLEDEFFGIVRRNGAMIMFKGLGAYVTVKRCSSNRSRTMAVSPRLVGTLTLMFPIRTRWQRSLQRAAFSSQCP